eukprot:CAMPEP_0201492244 /NCGR_PEP_ID=MMETSP0151_2-20130828/32374_1 /ASSEMBLY_ACC=CAM_ASM_000257 /TAXON_ID=200890 /ORGANISM="Paramoeba atlantica, Strain 621/1 / CCAP 1560/9" /LENGTH=70 /DNA_ID=CAMNT_0047878959 /DNA_START=692 /DNA_END=904 /DNA_ORIENTATION=-
MNAHRYPYLSTSPTYYNFYNKGCWSNLRAFFLLDEEDTNPLTAGPALEKKKKKKKKIKRGAGGEVTQMAV